MKLSRILPPLAVASALLVTACGGDGDGNASSSGASDNGGAGGEAAQGGGAPTTRVAFIDAGQLSVFDDGAVHPIRQLPEGGWPGSVDFSADGGQMLGAEDSSVFLWNGPDGEMVEVPCDGCEAAFVDDASGGGTVVTMGGDGQITRLAPDTLESTGAPVAPQLPTPGEPITLWGDAGGRLVVTHYASSASNGPDMLSLLDPATGEQVAQHQGAGMVSAGTFAIDAEGGRIAYVGHPATSCGTDEVFVLDSGDLTEVGHVAMPLADDGILGVGDLFFNGDVLYATMTNYQMSGDGEYCEGTGSAGLWRLAGGETWEQVDPRPVELARPVEGLTDQPHTGWITITEDSQASFEPAGGSDADARDLGSDISGLWAMPTGTEVEMAGGSTSGTGPSGDEDAGGQDGGDSNSGGDGGSGPATTEGAIARFEEFLHALGEGDIDTLCEIAGPAAEIAEEEGISCQMGYSMVVNDLLTPEQAEALRTATVDPARVETRDSGEVHIPVDAVVADVSFSESDLGSYTLAHQDGDWYIVGQ